MVCKNCIVARGFPGYRMFNPACLHCGARIIQQLGELRIGSMECSQRRRAMLSVWVEHGHAEDEIRELAKGPLCIGPGKVTESDGPIVAKPHSHGAK